MLIRSEAGRSWDTSDFVAGELCLDFANTTTGWRKRTMAGDKLNRPADLVTWARAAGQIDQARARQILAEIDLAPKAAERLLKRARVLRNSIYRIFAARSAGERPQEGDLARLNQELARAIKNLTVGAENGGFGWRWQAAAEGRGFESLLWPVARAAADFLVDCDASRIRACDADTCGWLFYDTSKNGRRRWCDMSSCGAREKSRRHYKKQKAEKGR